MFHGRAIYGNLAEHIQILNKRFRSNFFLVTLIAQYFIITLHVLFDLRNEM